MKLIAASLLIAVVGVAQAPPPCPPVCPKDPDGGRRVQPAKKPAPQKAQAQKSLQR